MPPDTLCGSILKEDAEGGNGPHGMLTGRTGSGKSKLLRAIVLTLGDAASAGGGSTAVGRFQR